MGGLHARTDDSAQSVRLRRWSKWVVLGLIIASALAAVLGMIRWLPDADRVDAMRGLIPQAVEGIEIVRGELTEVRQSCMVAPGSVDVSDCGPTRATVLEGVHAGTTASFELTPDVLGSGIRAGDTVLLFDQTELTGSPDPVFSFYRIDRGLPMIWMAIIFVVVVVVVARLRGLMAIVSLGFAGVVVALYLLPALMSGQPAVPVTIASSVLILVVMLYATHGLSMRTSVALLGALIGVGLTAFSAWYAIIGSRIGGRGSEAAGLLAFNVEWIDVQQLVTASVILAGLGTLNDVTITQVSAMWELRGLAPQASRWELFRRGMRIGRDHIASTVYTLVFAYLGTALVVLVAAQMFGGSVDSFITGDGVAEEVLRALVGGIALVLAMPITTAIGALIVPPAAALVEARPATSSSGDR